MDKVNKIILAVVALIVVVGGISYVASSSDDDQSENDSQTTLNNEQTDESGDEVEELDDDSESEEEAQPIADSSESNADEAESTDQPEETTEEVATETPGQYVEYYDGAIQVTAGDKILFFHADWCTQCKRLESDIIATGVPAGLTVFEVDFDNSQDLRDKYGVNQQTTLVRVDDAGNELGQYSGYSNPSFQAVIDNLL